MNLYELLKITESEVFSVETRKALINKYSTLLPKEEQQAAQDLQSYLEKQPQKKRKPTRRLSKEEYEKSVDDWEQGFIMNRGAEWDKSYDNWRIELPRCARWLKKNRKKDFDQTFDNWCKNQRHALPLRHHTPPLPLPPGGSPF